MKAREYAAAGVPWLGLAGRRLRATSARQEGGRLVEDGGWVEGARRARRLAPRALRAGEAGGRQWAQRETIGNMAHLWERAFLDAIGEARAVA